jgi:hypothetical protein
MVPVSTLSGRQRVHTYTLSVLSRSMGVENVLLQMVTRDTEGDTSQPTSSGLLASRFARQLEDAFETQSPSSSGGTPQEVYGLSLADLIAPGSFFDLR